MLSDPDPLHPVSPAPSQDPSHAPIEVVIAAIWRLRGHVREVLITRRPDGTHLAGCWELPGGKVKRGETLEFALRRELSEEVGLTAGRLDALVTVTHQYPQRTVRLHAFVTHAPEEFDVRETTVDHRWVAFSQLRDIPLPAANEPVTRKLVEYLQKGLRDT